MVKLTKARPNKQLKLFNQFSIVGGQVNFKAFHFQNSSRLDLTGVHKVTTNNQTLIVVFMTIVHVQACTNIGVKFTPI